MSKPGKKPYGSTPVEVKVVVQMRRLARGRKGGNTPGNSQIARELNDKGLRTRCGGLWTAQGVDNVLARKQKPKKRYPKKQSLGPNDYLTPREWGRAKAALEKSGDDFLLMIFLLGVNTGLRVAEMCSVQIRDLPKAPDRHQIWVRKGKGDKQRSVAVDSRFTEQVRAYKEAHLKWSKKTDLFLGVVTRTVGRKVGAIGEMIGKPDLHPHALRHTYGTLLYHYTNNLVLVKKQMGHTSIKSTEIYIDVLSESKKDDIEQFGDGLAGAYDRNRRRECLIIAAKRQGTLNFGNDKEL